MKRRGFVAGVVGGIAILAGCSSDESNSTVDSPIFSGQVSGGSFESIHFEGAELVVEIPEDSDIEEVNIIDSSGERTASLNFASGSTRSTISMNRTVEAEWTFVGVNQGEEVDSVTMEFAPNMVIENFGPELSLSDIEDPDYDQLKKAFTGKVSFRNTGNAPFRIAAPPMVTSGVMQPLEQEVDPQKEIRLTLPNWGRTVGPDETTEMNVEGENGWVFNYRKFGSPQEAEDAGVCQGETKEAVIVLIDEKKRTHEFTVDVEYGGGPSYDGRNIVCSDITTN